MISQVHVCGVLFTSEQPKKNKMAFVSILSQIKLLFGALVIQLVWYCICSSSIFAFGTILSEPVQNFEPVQNILNWFNFLFCFCFCVKQKQIVLAPLIFILPLLFISTVLTSLTIPSLLSQHPSPYSFNLNAYLVSLEPQTFGFPLYLCPDALPLSHGDLDASSPIFLITYTQ